MIESPPERGEKQPRRTRVQLPITLEIIPTPPRHASHISVDHNASKRFVCPERMCGVFQVILSGLWRPMAYASQAAAVILQQCDWQPSEGQVTAVC